MSTVEKTVSRALRILRVIDARQPVKPADMSTAIDALNGMIVTLGKKYKVAVPVNKLLTHLIKAEEKKRSVS